MDEHDLLATCWTSAGALRADDDGARSPVPIATRIAAVVDAGFSGIGLDADDLSQARQTIGFGTLRRMLDDAGIVWIQLGTLHDWWTAGPRRSASDAQRMLLLEAAASLRASQVLVAADTVTPWTDPDDMTTDWVRLAVQAEEVGAQIVLEAVPWSNLSTVEQASRFAASAGHPNGGIVVDAMHAIRGGSTAESLRDGIDPATLFAVELSDGVRVPAPEIVPADESRDDRRAPGAGEWDLVEFVRVMRALGFDEPWGVEVATGAHRAMPVREALSVVAVATRAVLDAADTAAGTTTDTTADASAHAGAPGPAVTLSVPLLPVSPAPVSAVDLDLPHTAV